METTKKLAGNNSKFQDDSVSKTTITPFSKAAGICQVCGRKYRRGDFKCGVTLNGEVAICSFVPSNKADKFGRYTHRLKANDFAVKVAPSILSKPKIVNCKLADTAHLDRVYRAFLGMLELTPENGDELFYERELSDSAIVSNCYGSVPTLEQARKIMKELSSRFDLRGVAGFFTRNGNWRMTLTSAGYYIPYFNEKNEIVGLQIRLTPPPENGEKYIWFSSNGKENGCSSKMPLHFSNQHLVKFTKKLYFIEGALKAQIIAEKLNSPVVAIAGTGVSEESAKKIADSLRQTFVYIEKIKNENGEVTNETTIQPLQTIVLLPDADYCTNKGVKRAFRLLRDALREVGFEVRQIEWQLESGKGFDDVLIGDKKFSEELRYDWEF